MADTVLTQIRVSLGEDVDHGLLVVSDSWEKHYHLNLHSQVPSPCKLRCMFLRNVN